MPVAASDCRILLGSQHMTYVVTSVSEESGTDALSTQSLLYTSKMFMPGLANDACTLSTLLDSDMTAGALLPVLRLLRGASAGTPVTVCPEGIAANSPAWLGKQLVVGMAPGTSPDGVATLDVKLSSADRAAWGRCLTPLQTITTTTTGATVDGSAAAANGAIATLHVTTVTGSPTLTGKIQDSADGASWADVTGGAFSALTAAGSQHLSIAGTIRRYRRAVCTIAGGSSPSVTCVVSLATL